MDMKFLLSPEYRPRLLLLACGLLLYGNTLFNGQPDLGAAFYFGPLPPLMAARDLLVRHALNVLLHVLNVLLVYQLLLKFADRRLALVAAMIFCMHPLQSAVVSAISFRVDLLAVALILVVAIRFMLLRQGKRSWLLIGAGVLALLFMAGVIRFFMEPYPAALRFLYLPSLGASVLLASGLIWIWEHRLFVRFSMDIRRFLVLALVLDCAVITFQENGIWKDQFMVSAIWAKRHPDFYWGQAGLGREFYRAQMYQDAIAAFAAAAADDRSRKDPAVAAYQAMAYLKFGFGGKAKGIAEDMIRLYPSDWKGHFFMALFFDQKGHIEKARDHYKNAAALGAPADIREWKDRI